MRINHGWPFSIWLVIIPVWSYSGPNDQPRRFRQISPEQGLSQKSVYDAVQDPMGMLWFATQDGLNLFDGYHFKVFKNNPANSQSLSENYITRLLLDSNGKLWVGTRNGGLNLMNPLERRSQRITAPKTGRWIQALAEHPSGYLLIGSELGLCQLDPNQLDKAEPMALKDETGQLSVTAIAIEPKQIWIGTNRGLYQLLEDGLPVRVGTETPYILSLQTRSGHKPWVGTRQGLFQWDQQGAFEHIPFPGQGSSFTYDFLLEDRALWVGTSRGMVGYSLTDQGLAEPQLIAAAPGTAHGLSNKNVRTLLRDRSGTLWLGTSYGLNYHHASHQRFGLINKDVSNLDHNDIRSLLEGPDGTLWVGTRNGLYQRDQGTTHFKKRIEGNYLAMARDETGHIWLGGYASIVRLGPEGQQVMRLPAKTGQITSLLIEEDTILAGAYEEGLLRYHHADQFIQDPAERDAPWSGQNLNCLARDGSGNLWMGGDRGLYVKTKTGNALVVQPLQNIRILSLHIDRTGIPWIGTASGLYHGGSWTGTTFESLTVYTKADGLPNEVIYHILSDSSDRLWMSTNRGICQFNPKTSTFISFDVGHGLQADEFNKSGCAGPSSGLLYFGGSNGFNSFDPLKMKHSNYAPPVVLTSFKRLRKGVLMEEPTRPGQAVNLSFRDHIGTFEFAALDYAMPERNRYAYRLNRLGEEWVDLGASREVTFATLESGSYTLYVKARGHDGAPGANLLAIPIEIAPPPWRSAQAYALYILVVLFAAGAYILAQRRQVAKLETAVLDRTRQLSDSNQQLEQKNHEIVKAQQQLVIQEKHASLGTLIAGVAHEINNPTNFAHGSAQNLHTELANFREWLHELAGDSEDEEILNAFHERVNKLNNRADLILDGTRRIRDIIKDLRSFTGQENQDMEKVHLSKPLVSTVNLVRTRYRETAVISYNLKADPLLECQPARLSQVYMNLIMNSCQAIEQKQDELSGTIPGFLSIESSIEGSWVLLKFHDNGPGIPNDVQEHIFEPFYTTRQVGEGTGLGLSISYEIMQQHGGRIEVVSEPGQGTSFILYFPLP